MTLGHEDSLVLLEERGVPVVLTSTTLLQTLYATGGRVETLVNNAGGGAAVAVANTPAGTHDGSLSSYDGVIGTGDGGALVADFDLFVGWDLDPLTQAGSVAYLRYVIQAAMTFEEDDWVGAQTGVVKPSIDRTAWPGLDSLTLGDSESGTLQANATVVPGGGAWTAATIAAHKHGMQLAIDSAHPTGEILKAHEFKVEVWGSPSTFGIVRQFSEELLDHDGAAELISSSVVVTVRNDTLPGLVPNATVTVNGTSYKLLKALRREHGLFTQLFLAVMT